MTTNGPIDWRRGALYGFASAALFGLSAPLSKRLLPNIGPMLLAGLLYLGAGAGLTVVALDDAARAIYATDAGFTHIAFCQLGAEQIGPGVMNAGQAARLGGAAADQQGRTERTLVGGFRIALVRHELAADGALGAFHVVVEHRVGDRREMRHDEFSDQPTRIGKTIWMLVGSRIEQQARVLGRP